MNYEVLLSKLRRMPVAKAAIIGKPFFESADKVTTENYSMLNQAINILTIRQKYLERLREDVLVEAYTFIMLLSNKRSILTDVAFEEVKDYPLLIWERVTSELTEVQINTILKNYHNRLRHTVLETLIINLPENSQAEAIEKYKDYFNTEDYSFIDFHNCVCEDAKTKINELFPSLITMDYTLELDRLPKEKIIEEIKNNDIIKNINMDDIIEILLTRVKDPNDIFVALDILKDRLEEVSSMTFKILVGFLISRERCIENYYMDYEDINSIKFDIFKRLKPGFKKIGLKDSLSVLGAKVDSYNVNKIGNHVILSFIEDAYDDNTLTDFVNRKSIESIIKEFYNHCKSKTYTIEDLEKLVAKARTEYPQKLIRDDYIEAIVACGQLMRKGEINNQHELFQKLREKFKRCLIDNVEHDKTYEEDININGIFYRLIKETCAINELLTINTYKGLIYFAKAGITYNSPDEITKYLSDYQVATLDIKPLLRWKKESLKKLEEDKRNMSISNVQFTERMGLQLLLFFGELRGKYLLDLPLSISRKENLFDTLNYKNIIIDDNGKSIINEPLMDFFFGKGKLGEPNSIINKIARDELRDFVGYFPEVCNNYEQLRTACNGALTVKRILKHYNRVELPIELKPNEYLFEQSLREIRTENIDKLQKGVDLLHSARNRKYSTIPKVKGKLGNFTYEILDLDDPMSLATGYMLHNCFIIDGVSGTALEQSMKSENGRCFVVYHKGIFSANSWIWRNGDIVCFDSVEAGGYRHGLYRDEIKILDVYKKVAEEILEISKETESEEQRIKAITVGKSDFIWEDQLPSAYLNKDKTVARPLERDVHVYDSDTQQLLAGKIPKNSRQGPVSVQYKDPRKKVFSFLDLEKADIDDLDDAILRVNSIRYDAQKNEEPLNLEGVNQLFVGGDWYIITTKEGDVDANILADDPTAINECKKYANILGINFEDKTEVDDYTIQTSEEVVKIIKKAKVTGNRRG